MKYFPFCVYKFASIISVSELCVVINYVFPRILRYQNQNCWWFAGGGGDILQKEGRRAGFITTRDAFSQTCFMDKWNKPSRVHFGVDPGNRTRYLLLVRRKR